MKFLETFLYRAFKQNGDNYFISKSALDILLPGQSFSLLAKIAFANHEKFISVTDLPDELQDELSIESAHDDLERLFYKRCKNNSVFEASLLKDIEYDLVQCLENYRKYKFDFMSYGLSEEQAIAKSQTLCLMRTIKSYFDKYENLQIIYEVVKRIEVKGELDCSSAKAFYKQTRWLLRRGIFEGILLGKEKR